MSEREGYRQVWMAESVFQKFEGLKKGQATTTPPGAIAQQVPGHCGLVIIFGPTGDIIDAHCGGGGCGWISWLLGRTCMAEVSPSGGNHVAFCRCGGGWFDRIFGP